MASTEAAEPMKFKNVAAMLCVKFDSAEDAAATKSITFKAKKNDTEYWGLTGAASVTLDAENMLPVATEGTVDHVTLVAPEGGFQKNIVYYIPVYPVGTCTAIEAVFTDVDDKAWTKTNELDAELVRNHLLNIGAIPDPYNHIPEEISMTINFYNDEIKWPFENWVNMSDQVPTGDTYTYRHTYEHNGKQVTKDFEFVISKGPGDGNQYQYSNFTQLENGKKVLLMKQENSWIRLPGIPGMYLKSVSMAHGNKDLKKRFRLQVGTDVTAAAYYNSPLVNGTSYTEPVSSTITFPTTDPALGPLKTTQAGNSYVMLFTKATNWSPINMRIFSITVVYTKSQPVAAAE